MKSKKKKFSEQLTKEQNRIWENFGKIAIEKAKLEKAFELSQETLLRPFTK